METKAFNSAVSPAILRAVGVVFLIIAIVVLALEEYLPLISPPPSRTLAGRSGEAAPVTIRIAAAARHQVMEGSVCGLSQR